MVRASNPLVEAAALPCAPYSRARCACNVCSTAVARVDGVALLTLPQPFDFELSTERFRAFAEIQEDMTIPFIDVHGMKGIVRLAEVRHFVHVRRTNQSAVEIVRPRVVRTLQASAQLT